MLLPRVINALETKYATSQKKVREEPRGWGGQAVHAPARRLVSPCAVQLEGLGFLEARTTQTTRRFNSTSLPPAPEGLPQFHLTIHHGRPQVMEILSHINKRVKGHDAISLPLGDLIRLYLDTAHSMVRNFAIVYVEMGYTRCAPAPSLPSSCGRSLLAWPGEHTCRVGFTAV